jgi:hypothetical protein
VGTHGHSLTSFLGLFAKWYFRLFISQLICLLQKLHCTSKAPFSNHFDNFLGSLRFFLLKYPKIPKVSPTTSNFVKILNGEGDLTSLATLSLRIFKNFVAEMI